MERKTQKLFYPWYMKIRNKKMFALVISVPQCFIHRPLQYQSLLVIRGIHLLRASSVSGD